MKEIKLTQGKIALIDDEDYGYLNQFKWCADKLGSTFYAKRRLYISIKEQYNIYMHRIIMNAPKGMEVDHIDHNGLNNQKYNLRICTKCQNNRNKLPSGKSKYLGVSAEDIKYKAEIMINHNKIRIGRFTTEEAAARAYDKKAKEYFGEFANLNFK